MIDLKRFRKENKISQKEIADLLGVKQPYLSAIENRKRPLSEDRFKILYNHYGDIILKYRLPDVIIEVEKEAPSSEVREPVSTFTPLGNDFIAYLREKDLKLEEKEKEIRELIKELATVEAKLEMSKKGENKQCKGKREDSAECASVN